MPNFTRHLKRLRYPLMMLGVFVCLLLLVGRASGTLPAAALILAAGQAASSSLGGTLQNLVQGVMLRASGDLLPESLILVSPPSGPEFAPLTHFGLRSVAITCADGTIIRRSYSSLSSADLVLKVPKETE